jgi:hypothetical protein
VKQSAVLNGMQSELLDAKTFSLAALAIRRTINTLLFEEVCTIEEFMLLINLDHRNDWVIIADIIAAKLEKKIKADLIHPNDIKPWHLCPNYKEEFSKISNQQAWRSAHGAINSILSCVSARFHPYSSGK